MLSRTKAIYENCRVLDMSGNLLFKAGRKRLDWYLSRSLARELDAETIQLTFAHRGDGRASEPFYLQDMRNTCVVCGGSTQLTLHHIVPAQYRQHMPEQVKSHSSHDLLPLCTQCHDAYERHAGLLKRHLAECFNAPLLGIGWIDRPDINKAVKAAAALLSGNPRIPQERLDELRRVVRQVCINRSDLFSAEMQRYLDTVRNGDGTRDVSANGALMQELCAMEVRVAGPEFRAHGVLVVEAVLGSRAASGLCRECRALVDGGIAALVVRWRRHFVEHAAPAHLPDHWSVDYAV
ncbi:hypothetical protein LPJ53_000617 [Coemansia erecta]|uniref:HNH nuclease domain-containing protein n=1 Tax=Coemansia erecta TaxID=147472 RepID=A0A9W7Y772_9FUNG|nr:hypothetical protein LPJ53_000617 [Coemansia erecta]